MQRRDRAVVDRTLLVVGAQYNAGQQTWRVERDITEYSALLREPRPGFARDTDYYFRDPYWGDNPRATGRMIFYPATTAQPAPEVPDAIVPVTQGGRRWIRCRATSSAPTWTSTHS